MGVASDPKGIMKVVLHHYSEVFSEDKFVRPSLISNKFLKISCSEAEQLEYQFSVEEVKTAIWYCDGGKAPSPDGFNFNFCKSSWDVICFDVMDFVNQFYSSKVIPSSISSFITLVPKKSDPMTVSDHRPISLIGSLYKIISKYWKSL